MTDEAVESADAERRQPKDAPAREGAAYHDGSAESNEPSFLESVRRNRQWQLSAFGGAVVLGLLAASLHWSGLVLGGMLVGLVSSSLRRALLSAIAFGVIVLVVFSLVHGTLVWVELTPVSYLVVGAAIGLPLLGALARGIL